MLVSYLFQTFFCLVRFGIVLHEFHNAFWLVLDSFGLFWADFETVYHWPGHFFGLVWSFGPVLDQFDNTFGLVLHVFWAKFGLVSDWFCTCSVLILGCVFCLMMMMSPRLSCG